MMKQFGIIIGLIGLCASTGLCQRRNITFTQTKDTVIVGDTSEIATLSWGFPGYGCDMYLESDTSVVSSTNPDFFGRGFFASVYCLATIPGKESTVLNASVYPKGTWQYTPPDSCSAEGSFTLTVTAVQNKSRVNDGPERTVSARVMQNPFTDLPGVVLSVAKPSEVTFSLFDFTGREVRSIERECDTGPNEIELDGRDFPAGCYWYVLRGAEWVRSGKIMKF